MKKKSIILLALFFISCKKSNTPILSVNNSKAELKTENIVKDKVVDTCVFADSKFTKFIVSLNEDDAYLNSFSKENFEYAMGIFDNAVRFKDESIKLLSCSNLSLRKKRIIAQLMNGMDYVNYMGFIEQSYFKVKNGEISLYEFEHLIVFNNWAHRQYIEKYYKEDKVINLIKLLKKDEKIKKSEFESRLNDVLNGKAWEETIKFYKSAAMGNHPELLEGW